MHTDDEELISLFKRLKIGLIVVILFSIIFVFFIYNKFLPHTPEVVKRINNKEHIYVLIDNKSCTECKRIKEILKEIIRLIMILMLIKIEIIRRFLKIVIN